MTELLLYASTFITVFALGFQSLNVNQGQYVWAFFTSFAIGGSSLVLYRILPDATWPQMLAYLLGGATGIVSSMYVHKRTLGRQAHRPNGQPHRARPWPAPPSKTIAGRPVSRGDDTD